MIDRGCTECDYVAADSLDHIEHLQQKHEITFAALDAIMTTFTGSELWLANMKQRRKMAS